VDAGLEIQGQAKIQAQNEAQQLEKHVQEDVQAGKEKLRSSLDRMGDCGPLVCAGCKFAHSEALGIRYCQCLGVYSLLHCLQYRAELVFPDKTYFAILLEIRQYAPVLRRSPFQPKISRLLSYHVGGFLLLYSIISILDLRSVLLHQPTKTQVAKQANITALTLLTFFLEIFTAQQPQFIRKSKLKEERDGLLAEDHEDRTNANEGTALLAEDVFEGDHEDEEDEAQFRAVLDLMPDDLEPKETPNQRKIAPPPEVGASIFGRATFRYLDCEIPREA
jgi:hypothetical protein